MAIEDRARLNYDELKDLNLSIRADFEGSAEGYSVQLRLESSGFSQLITDDGIPYSLFGDTDGDYAGEQIPDAPFEDYTVEATLYATGTSPSEAIDVLQVDFRMVSFDEFVALFESEFAGYDLFDGTYDVSDFERLAEPATIIVGDRTGLDSPHLVKSVAFELEGPISVSSVENDPDLLHNFFLFGSEDGEAVLRTFPEGDYTFSATPYSGADASGVEGEPLTATFTIVGPKDESVAMEEPVPVQDENVAESNESYVLYPNPASSIISIRAGDGQELSGTTGIYDLQGKLVKESSDEIGTKEQNIDVSGLAKGIYFVKISEDKNQKMKKIMVE